MSPFNLADYEPVESRLERFWADHPKGRIATRLASVDDKSVVMVADVFKGSEDPYPAATGHAQETPGSNPVNKTSWIENCETSAIGRALANMGYAPKGQRPSREEMAKVGAPGGRQARPAAAGAGAPSAATPRTASPPRAGSRTLRKAQKSLVMAAKDAEVDDDLRHRICLMLTGLSSVHDMTDEQCKRVVEQLGWFSINRSAGLEALADWEARNGYSA